MGKKSRRPNRNKPKDIPAVASTAAPQEEETATDDVAAQNLNPFDTFHTFEQLFLSQDWKGALEHESEMNVIAKTFERSHPGRVGRINFMLGAAYRCLGREGSIESRGSYSTKATLYYHEAVEFAKKARNNELFTKAVISLTECYVETGRVDEAMDLHKSRCDEIGKDPDEILLFAEILQDHREYSRALEIIEEHLETIERSWENQYQCYAYELIAELYWKTKDYAKSIVYFERQLSIAKQTNKVDSEAQALNGLGRNYGRMGDYDNAMACLEQALVNRSELRVHRIRLVYIAMGDVLVAQEGCEKDAILMFQQCCGLFEEGNEARVEVFLKLGQAYTNIEAWDDVVVALEESISIAESIEDKRVGNQWKVAAKQSLGNAYLEKYGESLPERNDELIRKALFFSDAAFHLQISNNDVKLALRLDLAQEHYFLGDTENARNMLQKYLHGTVRMGASYCQACDQTCAKDAIMQKCSVCKVARYCSYAHSIQAWKKGRLCHKVMCPFLTRWRKIERGQDTTADLCDELCNDFFERVLASKPK